MSDYRQQNSINSTTRLNVSAGGQYSVKIPFLAHGTQTAISKVGIRSSSANAVRFWPNGFIYMY